MKKTKRMQVRDKGVDVRHLCLLPEALQLIKERASAKFDETVEVIFNCNLDPRKGDQNLRSRIQLPAGTGKAIRVLVFAVGKAAEEARQAGADIVGGEELVARIQEGWVDFDLCIATPDLMPIISKLGKILGPKSLMPNPKLGTVSADVSKAVKEAKAGQVFIRTDKTGIIHGIIGKASFSMEDLVRNFSVFYQELVKLRPATLKGGFIKTVFLSSTMGFALPLALEKERVKGLVF